MRQSYPFGGDDRARRRAGALPPHQLLRVVLVHLVDLEPILHALVTAVRAPSAEAAVLKEVVSADLRQCNSAV